MMRAFACAAILPLILAGAPARGVPRKRPPAARLGAWDLSTTNVNANLATGDFSAPSPVVMRRADGSTVHADRAIGNFKKKRATLLGHVVVHDTNGTFGLSSAQHASHEPATLSSDRLVLDDAKHVYDASGSVHYVQGRTTADAAHAHLNDAAHRLDLQGNVHIVQGDRTLSADSATYNTLTGDGEADGNATAMFPGISPSIATPKPIVIRKPRIP